MTPSLYCRRRNTRNRSTVGPFGKSHISNYKYFRTSRNAHVCIDHHPPLTIYSNTKLTSQWRSHISSSPNNSTSRDFDSIYFHVVPCNSSDFCIKTDLDTKFFQLFKSFARKDRIKCRKNVGSSFYEDNPSL